jgi:hypothetical protein
MHRWLALCLALGLAALAAPAAAQDAEALRKELAELRRQLDQMSNRYQTAIEALTERLGRLEPPPKTTMASPPPAPPAVQGPVPPGPPATPSPMDFARPRQPFELYERRRPGQLLFDIGIVSDFVGNVIQDNVDRANAGTFFGRENRVFPREIEVNLYGRIDP